MGLFAVIDTETTWSGSLMTVGVLIVDAGSFEIVDYRYYVISEALLEGGMYSHRVHMKGLRENVVSDRIVQDEIYEYLRTRRISSIFAYNATFDKRLLPALDAFRWHDIMRLAAYKQYNSAISDTASCCSTGRLKSGYSVEGIIRMFGKSNYAETHNALVDARDELEIMYLLGYEVNDYPEL